jgi:pimeloyl-ACP methyl ester carboxylesterase
MWQVDAERLAAAVRVITPDLPGFGRSPRLAEPSIPAMAQAVAALLDGLGLSQPVIVAGLSMGGYVAFEFLRQFPTRVNALGLFSTRAAPDSAEQRQGRLKLADQLKQTGIDALMHTAVPKLLGPTTGSRRPAVAAEVERAVRAASVEGVIDALRAMAARCDSQPLLASITCPTLVVAGREDRVIPAAESETMAKAIPGARLEVIPEAGHLVNLERPDEFQAVVEGWLR